MRQDRDRSSYLAEENRTVLQLKTADIFRRDFRNSKISLEWKGHKTVDLYLCSFDIKTYILQKIFFRHTLEEKKRK